MIGNVWKPALALGAALAWAQAGSAEERDTPRTAGGPAGTTMTLGGKGTASQAATEDNELTHGYRRRGGYGWNGGWGGYRGGYYGGWGGYRPHYHAYHGGWGGWGGYRNYYSSFSYSTYRPAFYHSPVYYSAPVYSYYPSYHDCYDGWGGYGSSVSLSVGFGRIGASAGALGTPTVPLGSTIQPSAQPLGQPSAIPAGPGGGTFPYDGGPANPVPQPLPDANPVPPPAPQARATDLPVSLKPKAPTSPYRYKAYGEK